MNSNRTARGVAGILFAISVAFSLVIPSQWTAVFASPDETAVAVTARQIWETGQAKIPEPDALRFPWLHPRSFVSQGEAIAPVGFLGGPWLFSWFVPLVGVAGLSAVAAVLVASGVIPLFFLLASWKGVRSAALGAMVYVTAPPLLLYANRSLFPNGMLLALGLWACWLLVRASEDRVTLGWGRVAGAFALASLALAVRPVEAIWLVPWFVWFGRGMRWTRPRVIAAAVGAGIVLLPIAWTASATYGAWFQVGYWLRDNPMPSSPGTLQGGGREGGSVLPYGFHPRHILRNIRDFFPLVWPYVLLAVGGIVMLCRAGMRDRRASGGYALLSLWTIAWLLAVYGSGQYADHIQPGAIAVGNSFLRYLMPIALLAAAAWTAIVARAQTGVSRMLTLGGTVCMVVFGGYQGVFADEEGVLATRRELGRYQDIRLHAEQGLPADAAVFSERSDKIFFPVHAVASPLPRPEEIARYLQETKKTAGLFARPLSQHQLDEWRARGVLVREQSTHGREKLYLLSARME